MARLDQLPEPTVPSWRHWVAVAWTWLFLAIFICQPLPNNGNVPRAELLPFLPYAILDAVDPPQAPNSPPRGVTYLVERLPLLGIAGVIATTALAAGSLLLSVLPDLRISIAERGYFALLIGFGLLSLVALGLGWLGLMSPSVFWFVHATIVIAAAIKGFTLVPSEYDIREMVWTWRELWWLWAAAPFVLGMTFGSLSPSTDFDVNEYHLGGPKEWYLAGRVEFLEHNIYTSFPFLTEMLLLDGMVLLGDWYWGGIAGQAVLMLFAPLTAFGIWLLGRRWFSQTAGAVGAFIYLTTPWVFRMSIIAYAEGGLSAYVFGTVFAGMLVTQWFRDGEPAADGPSPTAADLVPTGSRGGLVLTGLCAGGAMACKYTGLVMAVAPWGGVLSLIAFLRALRLSRRMAASDLSTGWRVRPGIYVLVVYIPGVAVLVGPWLLKNLFETGNPVYPLAYGVFDGRDLDAELAEKFRRGHARPSAGSLAGEVRDFGVKAFDVAAVNDWQSPLVFAFAPLALWWSNNRKRVWALWGMVLWLFVCWWGFTHHLDRFWLPLLPVAAALAGIGFASIVAPVARGALILILVAGTVFNLGFVSTGLVGYNAGLTQLQAASDFAAGITGPEIAWINQSISAGTLPPDTTLLCIGEAELFHARFPYVYNTVFDRSIFEEWCGEPGNMPSAERSLRSAEEIRRILREHGITHIYVNWSEVLRYRQTYGYSDFVHPRRFDELIALGVLQQPLLLPQGLGRLVIGETASDTVRYARQWAPELIAPCGSEECLTTGMIYPVAPWSPATEPGRVAPVP